MKRFVAKKRRGSWQLAIRENESLHDFRYADTDRASLGETRRLGQKLAFNEFCIVPAFDKLGVLKDLVVERCRRRNAFDL